MRKHLYWGVVIFGHFVPDSAFGTHAMLFVIVRLPVLNDLHTNSCSGPRLLTGFCLTSISLSTGIQR